RDRVSHQRRGTWHRRLVHRVVTHQQNVLGLTVHHTDGASAGVGVGGAGVVTAGGVDVSGCVVIPATRTAATRTAAASAMHPRIAASVPRCSLGSTTNRAPIAAAPTASLWRLMKLRFAGSAGNSGIIVVLDSLVVCCLVGPSVIRMGPRVIRR